MPSKKPNVTNSAPIGCVDLLAADYEAWPCTDCLPWHCEALADEYGTVWIREWHAVDCPMFQELLDISSQPPEPEAGA